MEALEEGINVTSLDQKSATGAGKAFAVPSPPTRHGGGPREVAWEYRPGSTKPDAITIELRGAMQVDANDALVDPVVIDSYTTPATATTRTAAIGKFPFLDVNISALTIGGGDPIDGLVRL